jgi:hypothetical protein
MSWPLGVARPGPQVHLQHRLITLSSGCALRPLGGPSRLARFSGAIPLAGMNTPGSSVCSILSADQGANRAQNRRGHAACRYPQLERPHTSRAYGDGRITFAATGPLTGWDFPRSRLRTQAAMAALRAVRHPCAADRWHGLPHEHNTRTRRHHRRSRPPARASSSNRKGGAVGRAATLPRRPGSCCRSLARGHAVVARGGGSVTAAPDIGDWMSRCAARAQRATNAPTEVAVTFIGQGGDVVEVLRVDVATGASLPTDVIPLRRR